MLPTRPLKLKDQTHSQRFKSSAHSLFSSCEYFIHFIFAALINHTLKNHQIQSARSLSNSSSVPPSQSRLLFQPLHLMDQNSLIQQMNEWMKELLTTLSDLKRLSAALKIICSLFHKHTSVWQKLRRSDVDSGCRMWSVCRELWVMLPSGAQSVKLQLTRVMWLLLTHQVVFGGRSEISGSNCRRFEARLKPVVVHQDVDIGGQRVIVTSCSSTQEIIHTVRHWTDLKGPPAVWGLHLTACPSEEVNVVIDNQSMSAWSVL